MKKVFLFVTAAILTGISFSSCKKDDAGRTTLQKLQGKWTFQKQYYHDNYSGVDYRDTTYGLAGDYFDFRTDGKVYIKNATYFDTANYSLLGDTKIVATYVGPSPESDTLDIITLTDTECQLYSKIFDPAPDYYESTLFLTK
jgi:hypothetical protein